MDGEAWCRLQSMGYKESDMTERFHFHFSFASVLMHSGLCLAAVLLGGVCKFGTRAELSGTRRKGLTIPAVVCLCGSTITQSS